MTTQKTHFADDETLERIAELRRQVRIEQLKNAGSLANNLCPDHRDKQVGRPCLACEIERITKRAEKAEAELRRYKEAKLPEEPLALEIWRNDKQTFARTYQEVLVYIDALRTFAAAQTVRAESNERDAALYRLAVKEE